MKDLQAYLHRIGYQGNTSPNLDTLFALHRSHVSSVPFENLDIHYRQWITLDKEKFYDKIVDRKRGGFCYELNGLFYEVLLELGYQAYFIASSVYLPHLEKFGPNFAHVSIVVEVEGGQWLVDVGFGSSFPEPLKIKVNQIQEQDGVLYVLQKINEAEISVDRSLDEGKTFTSMYKFTLNPRNLEDFQEMCEFHQTSEQSPLFQKKLCSIATSTGRITLTPNHLIISDDGQRTEVEITDNHDFEQKLFDYFGIQMACSDLKSQDPSSSF